MPQASQPNRFLAVTSTSGFPHHTIEDEDDNQFLITEPRWREALAPDARRALRCMSDLLEPTPYAPPDADYTYSFDRHR